MNLGFISAEDELDIAAAGAVTFPTMKSTTILSLALLGASCSPLPLDHPDTRISGPAEVGGIVGIGLGIPLTVIALPVTIPLSRQNPSPDGGEAYTMAAPSLVMGSIVGNAVGSVPWVLFQGWKSRDKEQGMGKQAPPAP